MMFAARTFLTLTVAVASISPMALMAADTYTADPVHSSVVFRVKHANTSHAWGRFDKIEGSFTMDPVDATQTKLAFTIPTASVNTNNAARDGHLKSPDFFNAVQFPTITFASDSVSKTAKGIEVKGSLTFHGVTKPVSFYLVPTGTGKDMKGNAIAGIDANFVVKQSDFGIKTNPGLGDEVSVFVSIEGAKK
jgi:polyisoprenoid-binding protein YceI